MEMAGNGIIGWDDNMEEAIQRMERAAKGEHK